MLSAITEPKLIRQQGYVRLSINLPDGVLYFTVSRNGMKLSGNFASDGLQSHLITYMEKGDKDKTVDQKMERLLGIARANPDYLDFYAAIKALSHVSSH